ncbi:flagellar hook-basal body complex protein [Rhodanobacter sp. A1T4]|uniref:flagellar hook-basal body protein n=1 Tax=Rhodanobacter sp. A1T4 TaxID=2723087 RepID=UPI00160CC917|nr:flagellar hook-basal body complex protein [Rhodanobacter sp. A1T4]MBB6247593.1 flagellar basal body rod protein FlgG [Rhodanobacter sp. A1T4]
MSNIVSGIARYLSNDVESLDVLSQNVANMRTAGYRTERLKTDFKTGTLDSLPSLNLADGSRSTTGHSLDVAIEGPGFFVVDANGKEMLTRNGQFHIDSDQQLVDAAGHPVQGQSGNITLKQAHVRITATGEIFDGNDSVDTLRVVGVADPTALREAGDSLYSYAGAEADFNGSIHQGALEQSNVDPGEEIVRLMSLTRHAQSVQRAIQAYDEAMQSGINHLGENS